MLRQGSLAALIALVVVGGVGGELGFGDATPPYPVSDGVQTAFPGAEGHGARALVECARDPVQVLRVTTTDAEAPGGLLEALAANDPRRLTIVVFTTGGTIRYPAVTLDRSCLYLAGQTAPGDGIQIYNPTGVALVVGGRNDLHDVVARYIRLRSGRSDPGRQDVANLRAGRNVVLDHVSMQFGNDEVFSVTPVARRGLDVTDISVQWSIIAAGLRPHSTGSLVSVPKTDTSIRVERLSFHRNLWAHSAHRNPRVQAVREVQLINNVAYNWKGNVGGIERGPSMDMVGNYFKAGPWSRQGRYMEHDTLGALVSVYSRGNVGDPGQLDGSADQRWFITYRAGGGPVPGSVYASAPISVPLVPLTEVDAHAAYESVLTGVGASAALTCDGRWRPARDRLDALMIDQVRNRTGPGADDENDHPDDYGGVPDLAAGDPCPDLDGDGMPDAFEARWGLDPADPTDVSDDPDDDGYTNVEEFVNGTAPSSSREVR